MLKTRIKYNAPVSITLIIVTFLVFFLDQEFNEYLISSWFTADGNTTFSYSEPLAYIKFITHVFGHYDISHLMGNGVYIILLGPLLEEKYGSKQILGLAIVTAILSGLINAFFVSGYLLGASGIVYLYIFLASFTNVEKGEFPITAIILIGFYIYKDLFLRSEDNVSIITHCIGAVIGILYGIAIILLSIDKTIEEKRDLQTAQTVVQ